MGIGFLEILIIGVAALVLLGPERLPEIMRQAARIYVQLRRTSNEFKSAFDHVVREAEADLHKDNVIKLNALIQEIQQKQSDLARISPINIDVSHESDSKDTSHESTPAPRIAEHSHWENTSTKPDPLDQKT